MQDFFSNPKKFLTGKYIHNIQKTHSSCTKKDRCLAQAQGLNYPIKKEIVIKMSENWKPYRSVATWYFWRSLDPIPVEY